LASKALLRSIELTSISLYSSDSGIAEVSVSVGARSEATFEGETAAGRGVRFEKGGTAML
jgi:hypothetical protein